MRKSKGLAAAVMAVALFVIAIPPAIAQDRRADAEAAMAAAEALEGQRTADAMRKAILKYEEATAIWQEIGDKPKQANSLLNSGKLYQKLGETTRSIIDFDKALALSQSANDKFGQADALLTLSNSFGNLGNHRQAQTLGSQALLIAREINDKSLESIALVGLGFTADALGEKQVAINYYNEAVPIVHILGEKRGEASILANLGAVFHSLGEFDRAIPLYEQALVIAGELNDPQRQSIILNNLGAATELKGEYQKAFDYYSRSLVISKKLGDRRAEATTLGNLAGIYESMGDPVKGLATYEQTLAMQRELKSRSREAVALSNIGKHYLAQNDLTKAFEYYTLTLPIRREVGDIFGEAKTLSSLATIELKRGNRDEALRLIKGSIAIVESVRATLASPELRTTYFASIQEYYRLEMDVLMSMHDADPSKGYNALALQTSEHSRARGLIDLLSEAKADIRQGVDPILIAREKELQKALSAKDKERRTPAGALKAEVLDKDIAALSASLQDLHAEIRVKNPHYAALAQPEPLNVADIQKALDPDTLLIEYSLNADSSYLWVVSRTTVKSFRLPKRSDVEEKARKLYEITSSSISAIESQKAAADLGKMLLDPAIAELGKKRLAIVTDGVLGYIPFAALKTSGSQSPLIVDHEIVYLPSISTLAAIRSDSIARKIPNKSIAVIADPVFAANDTRVDRTATGKTGDTSVLPVTRATRDAGFTGILPRLPATRREATTILSFVPGQDKRRSLDFDASFATVVKPDLGDFRIIHFATHGLLNSMHPELSGIVLSLVDKKGDPQDGFCGSMTFTISNSPPNSSS